MPTEDPPARRKGSGRENGRWVFEAIAIALGLFGLAVLLLLALPLHLDVRGVAADEGMWGAVDARWGHVVLRIHLRSDADLRVSVLGIPFRPRIQAKPDRKSAQPEGDRWRWPRRAWARAGQPRVLLRMGRRVLKALHVRLYVGGRLGLPDPADAAPVLAFVRVLGQLTPEFVLFDLKEDWLEDTTELVAHMSARLVPIELAAIGLGWILRSDTRRVLLGT